MWPVHRDSVDVRFTVDGEDYVFVDTAGVRKRARITDTVEKYSVNSAIKSAGKADVTLLTLDASEGVGNQDKRLMDMLDTRKIPFIIIINKSDLIHPSRMKNVVEEARKMLGFCKHVPILITSARAEPGWTAFCPSAAAYMRNAACMCPRQSSTGP